MIEQGVAAAMSQSASSAVASPPPPAERTAAAAAAAAAAVDTDVSHTTDGRLEELRLSAAAMHRRLLACEELAADAAARTERGLTEALPAMEQRLTETAVSESGRALREEIAGVRARCSSMEDQVEAGLRSSTAAIEHGLASLSDALRSEISSTNSGLCRAEDLRQAAAELRGSVTDAQNTAAKSYADLRQEVADQLMAAAAQTRTRFEESSASSDGRLQGMAERLDSMTGAIGAVEAGASARFEEIAVQMTQMAAAVDAQIEVASESMTMTVREGAEAAVNAVAQLEGEMRDAHREATERAAAEQAAHQAAETSRSQAISALEHEISALQAAIAGSEESMARRVAESERALANLSATVEGPMRAERGMIDTALSQLRQSVSSGSDTTAALKHQLEAYYEEVTRGSADREDWRREIGARWTAIHTETREELAALARAMRPMAEDAAEAAIERRARAEAEATAAAGTAVGAWPAAAPADTAASSVASASEAAEPDPELEPEPEPEPAQVVPESQPPQAPPVSLPVRAMSHQEIRNQLKKFKEEQEAMTTAATAAQKVAPPSSGDSGSGSSSSGGGGGRGSGRGTTQKQQQRPQPEPEPEPVASASAASIVPPAAAVPAASLPPTTSLADTLAQRRALREQQQQVVTAAAATGAGAAAGSAAVSAVVRARFRRYDDDNDGRLNRAEVARVLEDLLSTTAHVHTVSGGDGSQRGQRRTGVLQSVDTVMAAFGVFDYRAAAGAGAGAAAESGVGGTGIGIGGAGIGTTRSLLSEQGVLTVEGFQQLWDTAISMDHAAPAAQPDRAAAGGGGGGGVFSLGTMSRSSSSAGTGCSAAQLQPPPSPMPTPAPGGGRGGGGGGRGAQVTGLTPAQFDRYDLDGDGLLNIDELAAFLEAVSQTAAAAAAAGGGAGGGSSSSLPHPLPRGYLMGLIGQFCGTGTTAAGAAAAEGVGRTELPRLLSFLFSDK
jgi:hypothetical protein